MTYRIMILIGLITNLGRADGLSDLKTALEKLNNRQPIRAQVKAYASTVSTEDKKATQASGSMDVTVEHNSNGVRILWSTEDLDRVREESEKALLNADTSTPLRSLMNSFSASTMDSLLAHGDDLTRLLMVSQLVSETSETRNGQPVRKLLFKVNRPLKESERKSMKSYVNELSIWIDENGIPVASVEKTELKGSRFLISFDVSTLVKRSFRRIGDRLVVSEFESNNKNSVSIMGTTNTQSRFTVAIN